MFMTVSRFARKNAEPCTQADIDTIIPAMPSRVAYKATFDGLQTAGDVIYRSGSINGANEIETVTLYRTQQDYDTFKIAPELLAFKDELLIIYNLVAITEEVI